jgi:hypothetical protein
VQVDVHKCLAYGEDCKEACIEACKKRHILQPFRPEKRGSSSDAGKRAEVA